LFFLWDFCYFLLVRATRDGAPDTRNRYDNAEEGEKERRGGSRKSKRENKRGDGAKREDERKIARRETKEEEELAEEVPWEGKRQTRRAKRLEDQGRAVQHRSHHSSRWREMNTQTRDEGTQDKKQRNRGATQTTKQSKSTGHNTGKAGKTNNKRANEKHTTTRAGKTTQTTICTSKTKPRPSTETTKQ
jgi:hypothetical protein